MRKFVLTHESNEVPPKFETASRSDLLRLQNVDERTPVNGCKLCTIICSETEIWNSRTPVNLVKFRYIKVGELRFRHAPIPSNFTHNLCRWVSLVAEVQPGSLGGQCGGHCHEQVHSGGDACHGCLELSLYCG